MSNQIYSDAPLERLEDDTFNRKPFAKHLAGTIALVDASQGFIFGLYGPWGSGKTTLINFIVKSLESENANVKVFRFNPWWFSGSDALLYSFFSQLRIWLNSPNIGSEFNKLAKAINGFKSLLLPLKYIPSISEFFKSVEEGAKSVSNSMEEIGKALEKDIDAQRKDINEILRSQNTRLLIILDDIDRLYPNEMLEIFRLVKSVADFPNIIYLLSFDREVVKRTLGTTSGVDPEVFLEKIIQLPYHLPAIDKTTLLHFFTTSLQPIMADSPERLFNKVRWSNLLLGGLEKLINTPRQAKRLLNTLAGTFPLVRGEVNPVDFIAMEAIRIFAPDIYFEISKNTNDFVDETQSPQNIFETEDALKNYYSKILESVNEPARNHIRDILYFLFPKVRNRFHSPYATTIANTDPRKFLLACDSEHIYRYIRFGLAAAEISSQEFEKLIGENTSAESISLLLKRLGNEPGPNKIGTRARNFARLLLDNIEEIDQSRIHSLIRAIFETGDDLIIKDPPQSHFVVTTYELLHDCWYQLIKRTATIGHRGKLVREAFQKGNAIYMMADAIYDFENEYQSDEGSGHEPLVSKEMIIDLKTIWLDKIKQAVQNRTLIAVHKFGFILGRWEIWGDEKDVEAYIKASLKEDENLPKIIEAFGVKGFKHGLSDRGAEEFFEAKLGELPKYMILKQERTRAQNMLVTNPTWLTENEKNILREFISKVDQLN
jgi:predicted KAP-like P-loop ATPase